MTRALVSTRAAASLGFAAQLAARALTPLWVAAADIGELLFARWLCDGAAVAVACAMVRLAAWACRGLQRAAWSVFGSGV